MARRPFAPAAGALLAASLLAVPVPADETAEGERLFRAQCLGCHSLEPGKHLAGPSLHGLIGRPAGSVEDFDYSPVLREAEFVWSAETLDAFLTDPEAFLPGTRMVFWGLEATPRRRVIHFLESRAAGAER
ncbi:c-type cytochrome [Halomonas ramblicola]|uniref:c-type cytochrome n=1 Tax=Halomonas ramblicola TaxID=747349 RepID=UPI0025B4334E|nr:c-type cytochrome [Halomonas ramblicola]MDN3523378.1 c-type cytochrome [Halomonas ramblicola]